MAFDNFIARAVSDTSHPFYPLPGSTRDSYLPEDGDGQPTTAVVNAASSEVSSAGRRTQQTAWAAKLKSSLTVTDTRLVFASTDFLRGFKKIKGHSFVGHVRYEWLAAVTASDLHFGRSPNQVRVVLHDPVDSDGVNVVTFDLARGTSATAFAAELVRRASYFRSQQPDDEFGGPLVNTTQNGGTRWLLPFAEDSQRSELIDALSSARVSPLA